MVTAVSLRLIVRGAEHRARHSARLPVRHVDPTGCPQPWPVGIVHASQRFQGYGYSHRTGALNKGGLVEITTTGRKSGQPRRIEIYLHNIDGDFYLTGRPGFPRDWVADLRSDPRMTLHLNEG